MLNKQALTMVLSMAFMLTLSFLPTNCHAFSRNPFQKVMLRVKSSSTIRDNELDINPHNNFHKNERFSKTFSGSSLRAGGTDGESSTSRKKLLREMLAEAIGTGLIVHLGCGTVCATIYKSAQVGLFQIAAVWAIAVSMAIYCTAGISGAHLNPAMTLAFSAFRDFPKDKVIWYWLAQLIGATSAAALNYALYAKQIILFEASEGIFRGTLDSFRSASAFGEYFVGSGICWKTAFFAEAFGTSVLAFLIFSLTNKNNKDAVPKGMEPILIGSTVAALISVIAPLTQAGFNPARDFGPRIISHLMGWGKAIAYKGAWVYIVAPLVGAIVGGYVADKVLWSECEN